ncbi:glutaminyl-peptide cyclotransferase-like [Amphibalanus amphitrite]|uniref:glutaminyl-peptide cyclotransferase-like n=1 Tax=Amphibalanus amphitrite TaxID=1232801 RepID=UPI001C902656|nr:glutaminyl-peptide cyclotransferase-like [Amphibalanus amphitrite]XP_043197964.1 glutaminyl-peptide cyclotransferase-like [Amphibalanus amphitrite]XP_043197965.1 glutaminyl-peptide cyclotransferase-like [Amphibalanus amphitrite]XP_043197966.1 glutaminyl-peptide cyclotransferase-like [Amphibalanus amphitrite]
MGTLMAPVLLTVCTFWCLLSTYIVSVSSASSTGKLKQSDHKPQHLEKFGLLETVALLDQELDLEAQLWSSLLDPMMVARYIGTQQHEDVRQHIMHTMTTLGWTVDGDRPFEMKTPRGAMNFTNVVATHDPSAPRRLVLACHYDSIYGRDTFVAATDSAVPCAMMLYMATLITNRYLDPMKGRSELTLQLLFLDGEEAIVHWTDTDSIYGARHLASELAQSVYQRTGDSVINDIDRIDCFVLLDLLGAALPSISNYQPSSREEFRHLVSAEERLAKAGLLPDLPSVFHYRDSWGAWGAPRISDDHLPFLRRGVKILHLIPHPFPKVWHDDSDNGWAIDFPTVQRINRVLRVFVAEYLGVATYL